MKKISLVILLSFNFCFAQEVSTLAGSTTGNANGTGTAAQFDMPYGVATDSYGNVYVADSTNHRIRKITPTGVVTTLAGSTQGFADGPGPGAQFYFPDSIAVNAAGDVFVADTNNNKIRKITSAGVVSTFAGATMGYADGTGTAARFNLPVGITIDTNGNLFVSDTFNNRIRKITPAGVVTTYAGSTAGFADGNSDVAHFNRPRGIAIDTNGNLYISDSQNYKIRKITSAGVVSTFAGSTNGNTDGIGTAAQFSNPLGVAVDANGNVYVADMSTQKIRIITPDGTVSTYAGSYSGYADGPLLLARFFNPTGVAVDLNGNVYVADESNDKIRKITPLLSVNVNGILNFKIYPNPVSQILTIQLQENIEFQKGTIYNTLGQLIKTDTKKEINVSDLPIGSYFIEVLTDKGKATKSFIIK